jgi:hypothetical protein
MQTRKTISAMTLCSPAPLCAEQTIRMREPVKAAGVSLQQ